MNRLPEQLYRPDQVAAMDRRAITRVGIPGLVLMQRAGDRAYRALRARWPGCRRLQVYCGTGNNGGDGYVIAALACLDGLDVEVVQLGDPTRIRGDAAIVAERYLDLGGRRVDAATDMDVDGLVVVDALFGTGLDRPLEGQWRDAVLAMNALPAPVFAVDIPSGLHGDTGSVLGAAVRADLTMTFLALKRGLFTGAGPDHVGCVTFDDLDVPDAAIREEAPAALRMHYETVQGRLAPRARTGHKGHYGHVLLMGGDHGMGGAMILAGMSALRGGSGLVSVATRERHVAALLAAQPELMAHAVTDAGDLVAVLGRASVVLLGPGLGRGDWGRMLYSAAVDSRCPLVVDADGLNLLAESPMHRDEWVLTPHPGEAARLLGTSTAQVQSDRFAAAEAIASRYGGVVILKGAGSIIACGDGRSPTVCAGGNPGMATGGTGDVLAGLVAALRGQGFAPRDAAEMATCIHAEAGDRVAAQYGERGMTASDLPAVIRTLVNP